MKILFCAVVLTLLAASTQAADVTADIAYYTQENPPYSYKDKSSKVAAGRNVELFVEIFREMGSGKRRKDIAFADAGTMQKLSKGKQQSALFAVERTPKIADKFKWLCPFSRSQQNWLVQVNNPKQVDMEKPETSKGLKFGVAKGEIGLKAFPEAGIPKNQIHIVERQAQLADLLLQKKIDVAVTNLVTLRHSLEPVKRDFVQDIGFKAQMESCIAFSKNVPDDAIAAHQKAFDTVVKNPDVINRINGPYGYRQ